MKLAILKDKSTRSPGYHYMVHPKALEDAFEVELYLQMGNIIIEVDKELGHELLEGAWKNLQHQSRVSDIVQLHEKINGAKI